MSNNREAALMQALKSIEKQIGRISSKSAFFYSAPVGFISEHNFVNTVCEVRTDLDVDEAFCIIDEQLNTKTELGTKIKLHGGEPFIVFPKIKQLCERLWSKDYPEYYH